MRKGRFLLFLLLLFIAAFLWAGGTTLMSEPTRHRAAATYSNTIDTTTTVLAKTKRILFLRQAVDEKVNKQTWTTLQDIPLVMQQAIISTEDNRFYRHSGFDLEGIARATLVNIQTGSVTEGGSTITQQLVKNLFLSHDQTVGRKFEELILALDMEMHYSKEQILEMYLNTIYFGSGAYGITNAANIYFGKAPANLTLSESALLAGLPNAPSVFSPYENLTAAKNRQAVVLSTMVRNGYLGTSVANEAKAAPLRFSK